ncbi:MAG: FHA domain-containing protein [Deltaproteobacteria bacterium]|nr:FHA domain-containing protein [Deltaproteobacteria bacterium]
MPLESAYIVIHGPDHNGTRLALREGITSFGRLPSNDVILLGDLVSRHHARIVFFDGKASLQDLGSHNGSWVNGEKVGTKALSPGDVMRIGNFNVTLYAGQPSDHFADEATAEGRDLQEAIQDARKPRPGSVVRPTEEDRSSRPRTASAARPYDVVDTRETEAKRSAKRREALPDDVAVRDPAESQLVREADQTARAGPSTGGEVIKIVFEVTQALVDAQDATAFLEKVLARIQARIPADGAIFRALSADEVVKVSEVGSDLRVSSSVLRWTIEKNQTAYSRNVSLDQRFKGGSSVAELLGQAIVSAPISVSTGAAGAVYLARPKDRGFSDAEIEAIEAIARIAGVGLERISLRDKAMDEGIAREALSRFHSPEVVDRILSGPSPGLEARGPVTVLCTDVPGFTELADELETNEVSEIMNDYIETISEIVFAARGTIHSLAGEGLMAAFGAPVSHGNDGARALRATLEMRAQFERLRRDHASLTDLRLRIALATGDVLAGTVGSQRRMDYKVLGGPVRMASRILTAAKPGTIVLDEATFRLGATAFTFRKVGKQPTQVQLYELLGRAPAQRPASRLDSNEAPT